MTVYTSGYVFQDDGDALNGATVQLLQVSDGAEEASTTTNSSGFWSFNETDEDRYDVKITSGTSIRFRKWADEISLKMVDARNNEGAGIPAATFTNLTNSAANQVAVFSGANSTKADDDEIYLSFKMHDSAGNLDEFARMTVVAKDVSTTTEDGQIEFDVMKAGTLTNVWTITSSTAAAMSFDMNVDALTIGAGTAATDITLTFDAESNDGVITWMEDEDYFKFSDDILMNSTEKILFGDAGTFIHQSSDGVLTITSDTTLDINGAIDFDGTDVQVDSSGDIDLVSTNDAAAAIYLHENAGTSGTIKIHADQGTSESSIQLLSDAGGVDINAATGKDVDIAGGTVNLTSSDDAASAIYLRANAGTSETIKIHADQGTGAASISAVSDVGGITLDAGLDIVLSADGGNVTMDDGTTTIFDFDVDGTTLTIHDDQDTGDKAVITMAQHGALSIVTTDDDDAAANIQITADGTVDIDSVGVLTLDSGAAINIEPASGSAILLDGTISVDAESIFATDIKIGEDDQTKIDFEDANTINFYANNAKEVVLAENSLSPGTSDGTALGTTSLMWSDLFVASGSVINFNNGDVTLTHSSNTLTVAGGTLAAAAITGTTIDASTDFTVGGTVITDGVIADDLLQLTLTDASSKWLKIYKSSSGATANSNSTLVLERDGNNYIQFLGPADAYHSIFFGDPGDATAGGFQYNHGSGSDQMDLMVGGASQIAITAADIDLQNNTLSNIGAAGNDFGAAALDLASSFTIQGAGRLNISTGTSFLAIQSNDGGGVGNKALFGVYGLRMNANTAHDETAGTNIISLFNGTAPAGELSNGASFFCASGQMRVIQANGTATDVSPHNPETDEWWFNSKDVHGRVFRVHMERLMRRLDEMLGGGFIEEYIED
jgi:hypothetical protein